MQHHCLLHQLAAAGSARFSIIQHRLQACSSNSLHAIFVPALHPLNVTSTTAHILSACTLVSNGLPALPSYSMLDRSMAIVLKVLVRLAHSKLYKRGAQGHTWMLNIVASERYLVYFTCRLAAVWRCGKFCLTSATLPDGSPDLENRAGFAWQRCWKSGLEGSMLITMRRLRCT